MQGIRILEKNDINTYKMIMLESGEWKKGKIYYVSKYWDKNRLENLIKDGYIRILFFYEGDNPLGTMQLSMLCKDIWYFPCVGILRLTKSLEKVLVEDIFYFLKDIGVKYLVGFSRPSSRGPAENIFVKKLLGNINDTFSLYLLLTSSKEKNAKKVSECLKLGRPLLLISKDPFIPSSLKKKNLVILREVSRKKEG